MNVGEKIPAHANSSTGSAEVTITVDQVRCGIGSIDQDAGSIEAPDGYRYCEADLDITNTGGPTTGQLSFTGTLAGDDGASYDSDPDATTAAGAVITTLNEKSYGNDKTPPLASGKHAETAVVWTLPVGIGPTRFNLAGSGITGTNGGPAVGPVVVRPQDVQWQTPKGQ